MERLSTGVDVKTQEKLIQALAAKYPSETQAGIARLVGLSPQRYNNYVMGIRQMDVDAVIGCAQALGWDIRPTVADHMKESASTPRERNLWRQLATTAATLAIVVAGVVSTPVQAAGKAVQVHSVYTLCEVATFIRNWLSVMLDTLRDRKPGKNEIQARLIA